MKKIYRRSIGRLAKRAAHLRALELLKGGEFGPGPYLPSYNSEERLRRAQRLKEDLLRKFAGARLEELYRCAEVKNEFGKVLRVEDFVRQELSLPDRHRSIDLLSSQFRLLYGIGPVTERGLRKRGYRTLEDLSAHPRFGPEASQLHLAIQQGDLPRLMREVERWFSCSHPLTLALLGLAERGVVFFDVESLGLFFDGPLVLLGLARPVNGSLLVEQYVIRLPYEEQAALAAAVEALTRAEALVTYNGRSFDVNYLKRRLGYYGLYREIGKPNFDLLHHARRRFKESLPDCRLETVERHILGVKRPFDLPSELVPDFYKAYLEKKNIGPLVAIIEHNKQDLVGLAVLLNHLCSDRGETWDRVERSGFPVRKSRKRKRRIRKKILGFSSEAYVGRGTYGGSALTCPKNAGAPFMFAASSPDGSWQRIWPAFYVREMLDKLARQDADIFAFNHQYEVSAILRAMRVTSKEQSQIWKSRGEHWVSIHKGSWEAKADPGKVFQIRRKGSHSTFTLLDAHNLLRIGNSSSGSFRRKGTCLEDITKYTRKYVKENWDSIAQYCLRKAMLTAELMTLLIQKVEEESGVRPQVVI